MAERRISLQVKLAVGLLVIAMVPLLVSAFLIAEVAEDAGQFRANEAAMRDEALVRSQRAYRKYFDAVKELHDEIAKRLAARAQPGNLAEILAAESHLSSIELLDASGEVIADERKPRPADETMWRVREDEHPLPGGGTLRLGFLVREDLREELKDLGDIQQTEKQIAADRSALPEGYQWGFLALVGGAAVVAIALGIFAAQRVTRRIEVLVAAARAIAEGKSGTRAELGGRDEMAELAVAFNRMLDALDRQRGEIEYLQRIGTWQDVARKLAHEIKNPLTPIQLAVQQLVFAYKGDDARFQKLLGDTGEIVEEEISGLRRLVDTFRTLGQLPRVEAHPLPLREVVEDLRLDPALADRLHVAEPAGPASALTVRADKLLLKRVLTNLVENGVHAGKEAGRPGDVTVTWGLADDHRTVAITIDDQGKGVEAADRERIFEPYVTTKATGTGLGLAIAKKIALEHGGTLAVAAARAPSGGARFVVTLPVDAG